MADASSNKSLIVNDFSPGLVIKRGTHATPNGLIALDNAWVEPDGSILSRQGFSRINTTPLTDGSTTGVHSHTLSGNTRYIGVGTVIKRGMDPGTNIITGLSGWRVTFAQASPSMATTEQWTYFCNGDAICRKKDNGTITRNWGIDGPTAAPTLTLTTSVPVSQLIDPMNQPYTVVDTGSETVAPEPYDGTARKFTTTTDEACRFRRTISPLDLSAFGEEGVIRMMIRVDHIPHVRLLGLAFDVGDGSFTKDFYEVSTRELGASIDNSWYEIRTPKALFIRTKSSGGSSLGWATVNAIQFTISGTGSSSDPFNVSVDDLRMEAPTHPDGVMDYRMTWWSDSLKIRSNSRSLSDIYTLTDRTSTTVLSKFQGITITKTATTSDAQVTHWELWRRNHNGAGIFQFVDRIPIGTSTYLDTFADQELGEPLVDDNHIPPPAKFVLAFDDCLFLFGMESDSGLGTGEEQGPYTVRFSARFRPESFPFTNYLLAGDPTDTIRGGCVWQNQIWIFTKKHVYRVEKTANGYVAQLTEAPVGTESPYSISPSPYGIFYYAPFYGPYVFNGATSTSISSTKIQPFFDGEIFTTDGITVPAAPIPTISHNVNAVGQFYSNHYTLAVYDSTDTCRVLVYNIEFQRWYTISGPDLVVHRLSSERGGDLNVIAKNLEAGTAAGWLLRLAPNVDRVLDPGGQPVNISIQMTLNGALKPEDSEMDLKDFIVDCDTGGQLLTVQGSFDDGGLEALTSQMTTNRGKVIVPVPPTGIGRICYKASVRLTLAQAGLRTKIYGIGANYWVEPRRALTYSALWHAPREKGWARRGRIVLRSYAPVTMRLVFDETKIYETTLPNTGGLRLGTNPTVITGMEGKVAYILFTSTEPFVMYESSFFEMGVFGAPAQMIPWRVAAFESRQ